VPNIRYGESQFDIYFSTLYMVDIPCVTDIPFTVTWRQAKTSWYYIMGVLSDNWTELRLFGSCRDASRSTLTEVDFAV